MTYEQSWATSGGVEFDGGGRDILTLITGGIYCVNCNANEMNILHVVETTNKIC